MIVIRLAESISLKVVDTIAPLLGLRIEILAPFAGLKASTARDV